jgi:hypothetical protein
VPATGEPTSASGWAIQPIPPGSCVWALIGSGAPLGPYNGAPTCLWISAIDSSSTRTASEGHATVGKNPVTVHRRIDD